MNRIEEDRLRRIEAALSRGESIRHISKTVGVAKGTVQNIRDEIEAGRLRRGVMYPTADQVAIAIVAACRETDGDPIALAEGSPTDRGGPTSDFRTSRARAYAGFALRSLFNCGAPPVARMVGAGSPDAYLSTIDHQLRKGTMRWWSEGALARVVAAVSTTVNSQDDDDEDEPEPPRPLVKLSAAVGSIVEPTRPSVVPGKRRLDDMLRAAVENTARMTPPPEDQP